jgi:hypothetical protein
MATLVPGSNPEDREEALLFVRDRATRIAITDAWQAARKVTPWDVVAIAGAVAVDCFGADEDRTHRLLVPVTNEPQAIVSLLGRIVGDGASERRDAILGRLNLALERLRSGVADRVSAMGRNEDRALADQLSKL